MNLPKAPIISITGTENQSLKIAMEGILGEQRDADHRFYQAEHDKLEKELIQQGRREVVEFLTQNCYVQNLKETGAWQSQLKEWLK